MLMFKIILFLFLWIENLIEFIEFHVFGDFFDQIWMRDEMRSVISKLFS